ncbi:aldehyde dehydrogenase [Chitinasiproducens palmae]|uniref:Betaine-aldehyde dehydrogenase n=1 Tax=Chitinasiproducens palmae TaxID=1770053 RepID=A0A1H2PPF1_9BURK|nr:aldehyde dehydrogenase [Chitinasiproducens palmae]SDV48638.1 betaine-aldehyde dehydrogenase [Chitinasiproducens palmae]
MTAPHLDFPADILVGGVWRPGRGHRYASIYPADQSVNAEIVAANVEDVEEAVAAADAAWRKANWAGLKPHQRAAVLYRISDLITQRHEALAQMQRRDNGKPISETRALVTSAANTFRYFAACLETLEEQVTPSRGDYLTMSVHEPLGVVAAITPWNSPIASDAQKLAPALAAGNAVILKPAEVTPLCSLALGRICEEAGVPKGVLSVLPGKGSVIGDALVKHPRVKKIAFTGGTEVGRGIARLAAEKLMPVSLELGGKSPTIVFADADLDHAVNGVLYGIFSSSGESCIAGSRLFVERSIYDSFVARLVAATEKLRVGDPTREDTQMGPLVTGQHRATIERYVALGLEEGGRLLTGGQRPAGEGRDDGFFFLPTIIDGLRNDAKICQEEIFGPVLVVLPFDNEADLLREANDSVFGLAAGIWTSDYKRAYRVARALETGTVWINTYKQFSISTPFGGWKESGTGREKGRLGILEYMQQKSLYWGLNDAPLPWAN